MKKILNILGIISLVGISTTSLIACNNKFKIHEYTKEELVKLKEEKNISTKNGILEWITPQEKPFNQEDNRWYFIIWKADKWTITKYKNNRYEPNTGWIIKELNNGGNNYRLMIRPKADFGAFSDNRWRRWDKNSGSYFKSVYRWNLDTPEPGLIVDKNGDVKVDK